MYKLEGVGEIRAGGKMIKEAKEEAGEHGFAISMATMTSLP